MRSCEWGLGTDGAQAGVEAGSWLPQASTGWLSLPEVLAFLSCFID